LAQWLWLFGLYQWHGGTESLVAIRASATDANILVTASMRRTITMSDFQALLINNVVDIIFAVIGLVFTGVCVPWIKKSAIPWLKEKQLYSLVEKYVKAAEKKAEAGSLAKALKKDYVIKLLEARGVTITDEVDAFIEAAVKELDTAVQSAVLEVAAVMEDTATSEE
jgi:hypothetical protein